MNLGVYCMRDVKTGFMTPTFDVNDQTAIRNFSHSVVNSDSILFSFAKDFSLYKLGEFDSDSGCIIPLDLPKHLYEAADAVRNFGAFDKEDK